VSAVEQVRLKRATQAGRDFKEGIKKKVQLSRTHLRNLRMFSAEV